MRLILPTENYRVPFLEMLDEMVSENDWYGPAPEIIKGDFGAYVRSRRDAIFERGLPEGRVPESDYWIVYKRQVVGRVRLRHRLSPRLELLGGHIGYEIRSTQRRKGYGLFSLAAVLPEAAKIGLRRVLLTCNDDNIGSIRIIEKNGAVLADKIQNPERTVLTRRYWIDLKCYGWN